MEYQFFSRTTETFFNWFIWVLHGFGSADYIYLSQKFIFVFHNSISVRKVLIVLFDPISKKNLWNWKKFVWLKNWPDDFKSVVIGMASTHSEITVFEKLTLQLAKNKLINILWRVNLLRNFWWNVLWWTVFIKKNKRKTL